MPIKNKKNQTLLILKLQVMENTLQNMIYFLGGLTLSKRVCDFDWNLLPFRFQSLDFVPYNGIDVSQN